MHFDTPPNPPIYPSHYVLSEDAHPQLVKGIIISKLPDLQKELDVAKKAAFEAGQILLDVRKSKDLQVQYKTNPKGTTPVTIADMLANECICKQLIKKFPDYGLLTEESIDDPSLQSALEKWDTAQYTWFVDPLDGTADFIAGGDQFGVHIGLAKNGKPILGVNYYPVTNTYYWAISGKGAFKQVGNGQPEKLYIAHESKTALPFSNSSFNEVLPIYNALFGKTLTEEDKKNLFTPGGSMGYKMCTIASGPENLYINIGSKGSLWDSCSGEVIIKEAGGYITDSNGHPLNYRDKESFQRGVVISSSKEIHSKVIEIFKEKRSEKN